MEYLAEIYNLSTKFYEDYPHDKYPEIVTKQGRPYSCLLLEYMEHLYICIPFRSHVNHKYAYHFKHSARARQSRSGLDYTKLALISDSEYLDSTHAAIVDQDEYKEAMQNLPKITKEVYEYIAAYRDDLNGIKKLHPREWERRYKMSTLPYFEEFLKCN